MRPPMSLWPEAGMSGPISRLAASVASV